jgi:hypothetical protein
MDKEVREEFDRMMAQHNAAMARHDAAMARMDEHEREMERRDRQWDAKHKKAMARMDKFERSLDGIRKLVQIGMKMLVRNEAETRELKKSVKAFLQSRNGGGNGHKGGNGRGGGPVH